MLKHPFALEALADIDKSTSAEDLGRRLATLATDFRAFPLLYFAYHAGTRAWMSCFQECGVISISEYHPTRSESVAAGWDVPAFKPA